MQQQNRAAQEGLRAQRAYEPGAGARSEWLLWPTLDQAQVPGPAPSPGGVSPAGGRAHQPAREARAKYWVFCLFLGDGFPLCATSLRIVNRSS